MGQRVVTKKCALQQGRKASWRAGRALECRAQQSRHGPSTAPGCIARLRYASGAEAFLAGARAQALGRAVSSLRFRSRSTREGWPA